MNISQLNALTKLISSNPKEAKALIKLASIDVLKSLGENKYLIQLGSKTLSAQSDRVLNEGAKYWTQYSQSKNSKPTLSNLLKMPNILKNLDNLQLQYNLKDIQTILKSKEAITIFKQDILEHLTKASNKEEFSNFSNLLLSLQNQTLTLPLNINGYFYLLQIKKRYNKNSKTTYLNFYTALEYLGPISGIISLYNTKIEINLSVVYEKTKQFLEKESENLSYNVNITLQKNIEPLYDSSNLNSLLDVSI